MKAIKKTWAVAAIKYEALVHNMAVLTGPFMTIGLVLLMRFIYQDKSDGTIHPEALASLLVLGISLNMCMNGVAMVSSLIAEEKEKHTLRVLMTASVTGGEYFAGTILVPLLLTVGVNLLILPITGCTVSGAGLAIYFVITVIGAATSCVIGMIVGIYSKNQMSASMLCMPVLFVFTLIPLFSGLIEGLEKITGYLFTGVLSEAAGEIAQGRVYHLDAFQTAVLIGELVIAVLVFLLAYRKNGYEKD